MIHGLYVVTDSGLLGDSIIESAELALRGGARAVQYRAKDPNAKHYREYAQQLRALTRRYEASLIINDDLGLANEVDADGVHIGRDDAKLPEARQTVGSHRIIGVSCYNKLSLAIAAESNGADYVAFGSVFSSVVKPNAVHAPVQFISDAITKLSVPVVAIGGINADNCVPLVQTGVDALAVISGVFNQPDIEVSARDISRLFTTIKEKI